MKLKFYEKIRKDPRSEGFFWGFILSMSLTSLVWISILYDFNATDEVVTRYVDIDDDGVIEKVQRIDLHRYHMLYVVEDDGTIFETEFDSQGNITYREKLIPVPGKEHSYIYYIWDDTFKQWVFDPNQG